VQTVQQIGARIKGSGQQAGKGIGHEASSNPE
jgi:hypothetical protein